MIRTLFAERLNEEGVSDLCARSVECGFEGVGLTIGEEHTVTLSTSESACRAIRGDVERRGLRVVALELAQRRGDHFGAAQTEAAARSIQGVEAALERAAWLGADTLVVVSADVTDPADAAGTVVGTCGYGNALNGTHAALQRLRFVAERFGVTVALVAPCNRFLLSPVELRELLDAQQSPMIGACLDWRGVLAVGSPRDWIHILGHRVQAVRLGSRGTDVADSGLDLLGLRSLLEVLEEVAYAGIIITAEQGAAATLRSASTA